MVLTDHELPGEEGWLCFPLDTLFPPYTWKHYVRKTIRILREELEKVT